MLSPAVKSLMILGLPAVFCADLAAQKIPERPAGPMRVEPGLENAVKWIWRVAPSEEKDWGLPVAIPTPAPSPSLVAAAAPTPEVRPTLYEVKRGDALILIGRRFGLTVAQLKTANQLKGDRIQAGQMLKIPSLVEASKVTTPPPPKKKKAPESAESRISTETGADLEKLRLQIFLDREQFSAGPIAGDPGPLFTRIVLLYQGSHEDTKDDASLAGKARSALGNVFTHYKLKAEDFRFIAPPKADLAEPKPTPLSHPRPGKAPARPPAMARPHLTYEQLIALPMLAYRTPWEFVAERFHCQESYLHALNSKLPAQPVIGTEFMVPDVIPFEIERAFNEPLQPPVDPSNPVTASVSGLSQLNIYQSGKLVAVFPISPARPGLHGRGSWTILDVIPRPRLATFREERPELIRKTGAPTPVATPSPPQTRLPAEEYLPAGPRNPAGILWINLAKAKSTEPLPYGLTGASTPGQISNLQSIGGFRLANWDIARAVRQLPSGTPLEWK